MSKRLAEALATIENYETTAQDLRRSLSLNLFDSLFAFELKTYDDGAIKPILTIKRHAPLTAEVSLNEAKDLFRFLFNNLADFDAKIGRDVVDLGATYVAIFSKEKE
ncbi:MAG: hypothetical protein LBO72_07310 [Helicobacteraceae bacterium]|jgi:hypothetical protein|nr:hypothetical protein [Helicobacteraceae bacterium]